MIYCVKAEFGQIPRSFASNSGAILLKRPENLTQIGFPSLRSVKPDRFLANLQKYVLMILIGLLASNDADAMDKTFVHPDENRREATRQPPGEEVGDSKKDPSAVMEYIRRKKESTETQGDRLVKWVDSFFGDEDYAVNAASSQFRIRPEFYYSRKHGLKPKIRVAFKLRLPNLEQRVSLFGGSSDDNANFDDVVDDDINESVVGIRFFGNKKGKWDSSVSVGLKFKKLAGFIGPRFRYVTDWSSRTSFRYIQKILWQTNQKWQVRSRFDFNFALSDRNFLRQMIDSRWRGEYSDEEGLRTRLSSFITHQLSNTTGLQGEISAILHTQPDTHVDEYVAALRYRKKTRQDWFYYEIVPQLSWEETFSYRTNPGIRLRIEIFFGANEKEKIWQREVEDSNSFRW